MELESEVERGVLGFGESDGGLDFTETDEAEGTDGWKEGGRERSASMEKGKDAGRSEGRKSWCRFTIRGNVQFYGSRCDGGSHSEHFGGKNGGESLLGLGED